MNTILKDLQKELSKFRWFLLAAFLWCFWCNIISHDLYFTPDKKFMVSRYLSEQLIPTLIFLMFSIYSFAVHIKLKRSKNDNVSKVGTEI